MPDRTVADNIRALMALHRVTQAELAAALGVSQSTVSDRQRGNTWPASALPDVARVLGVDVAAFFVDVPAAPVTAVAVRAS